MQIAKVTGVPCLNGAAIFSMLKAVKCKKQLQSNELTTDELRRYKGLENLTDAEAEEVATALQAFSLITYQVFENVLNVYNEQS